MSGDLLDSGGWRVYAWLDHGDVHARLSPVVPGLAGLADAGGGVTRLPASLWRRPEG